MAEASVKAVIWTAVVGAVATVAAAVITSLHLWDPPPPPTPTPPSSQISGPSPRPFTGLGVVRVPSKPNVQGGIPVSAWVYGTPTSNPKDDRIGQLADGTQVEIVCVVQGPALTAVNGTSSLWDRIKFNSGYGFLNDGTVDTGSNAPVAPPC